MIYKWLGPSGSNVKLGYVIQGQKVNVPAQFTEHFKSNKLIEEITIKDEKPKKKSKREA